MNITYLGTNTLLITQGDTTLLVDPHFSRPGIINLLGKIRPQPQVVAEQLARLGIHAVDGVLLTHTHYDHALDATEVLRQAGGTLYGSESAIHLAQGASLGAKTGMQVVPRQIYQIGAFQVCFHPARHVDFPAPMGWLMSAERRITRPLYPPTWLWNYQCGAVYAIQVDRTLIFGSAGFEPGAYRGLAVESVVLGVGGLDLQPQAYLQALYSQAVLDPGARQVFLSHWDNFFGPLEKKPKPMRLARRSISRINTLGAQHGQTVRQLEYGQTFTM